MDTWNSLAKIEMEAGAEHNNIFQYHPNLRLVGVTKDLVTACFCWIANPYQQLKTLFPLSLTVFNSIRT
jgi:hypothetical protein